MNKGERICSVLIGLCAAMLFGCIGFAGSHHEISAAELSPTPTATAAATATTPSATDSATATVSPTETATATPTPVITPTPFPAQPTPDDYLIRIEIKHGNAAQKSIELSSATGGTLGIVANGNYIPAVSFTSADVFRAKVGQEWHLQLSAGTTDFATAQYALYEVRQILKAAGIATPIFYLNDGTNWYVGAGFFSQKPTPGIVDSNGENLWDILTTALSGTVYSVSAHTPGTNTVQTYLGNVPVLVLTTSGTTAKIRVHPYTVSGATLPPLLQFNKARYRGDMDLHRLNGGNINMINEVEIEEYLYSVLPSEMINGSDKDYAKRIEGLKAQAVTARTKAYLGVFKGGLNNYGFHLYGDENSQVYGGYTKSSGVAGEYNNSTQAVNQTKGKVLKYNGRLVDTLLYHGNNGGFIETPNNVWSGTAPYLVSKADPWTVATVTTPSFTGAELSQKLAAYAKSKGKGDVGSVLYVSVVSRSKSGRVIELLIEGTKSSAILTREQTRTAMSLKSQLYNFDSTTILSVKSQQDGTNKTLSDRARKYLEGNTFTTSFLPDCYAVRGSDGYLYERIRVYADSTTQKFSLTVLGHGHGCGMSQDGAAAMSAAGVSYTEIVQFYMPGVVITDY